ncbi:hypothetical protein [Microbacterium atlanticum]|uniref:hypothetical protein n=1 Tax=Microbacterium atlanticum TaxID=2782168 RepID=UPI001E4CF7D9|nr:hypothetical protein [Microbacterium atlanticum]
MSTASVSPQGVTTVNLTCVPAQLNGLLTVHVRPGAGGPLGVDPPTASVTLTAAGLGTQTCTTTSGGGSASCTFGFPVGTIVTVTGQNLISISGDVSCTRDQIVAGTCQLTMESSGAITAQGRDLVG